MLNASEGALCCWTCSVEEAKQTQPLIQKSANGSRECLYKFLGGKDPSKTTDMEPDKENIALRPPPQQVQSLHPAQSQTAPENQNKVDKNPCPSRQIRFDLPNWDSFLSQQSSRTFVDKNLRPSRQIGKDLPNWDLLLNQKSRLTSPIRAQSPPL